jgi:hypothetical protein
MERLTGVIQPYAWGGDAWHADGDPFLSTWEDLINRLEGLTLVAGEIDPAGREMLAAAPDRARVASPADNLRRAGYLAEIAAARLAEGRVDNPAALAPTYMH